MAASQTSAPVGHTPGPWDQRREYDLLRDEIGVQGRAIAVVWVRKPEGVLKSERVIRPDAELEANARLIAAAPDLLEACQTFAEWLRREDVGLPTGIERDTPEGERQWRAWFDENLRICALAQVQARAAIAKATGAQS